MILKHVEYKIICDKCAHDIIGWDGFETREDVKEEYKKQYGKLPKKETLCDNCSTDVPAQAGRENLESELLF